MARKIESRFEVIRDTREQKGFWTFDNKYEARCTGTISEKLPTGDYTIKGLETIFTIERKASTGEIYKNINEKRFTRELDRFVSFKHTFLICEFDVADIFNFPFNSGIPKEKWCLLKLDGKYILRCLNEIMIKYNTQIIYAGPHGKDMANSILKRMADLYGNA